MKKYFSLVVFLLFAFSAHASNEGIKVKPAVDVNPDPRIFETHIEAAPLQLTLSNGETATVFAYNGQVPGPQINVKQGDRVIVHFKNSLPEEFPTTIHWHGIELNNISDGTPVTQQEIPAGGTYTYDFLVPRGGVFWYHPHIRGGQEVMAGLYGPLIIEQPEEHQLRHSGVLPRKDIALVLSDISIENDEVKNIDDVPMIETMNGTEGDYLLVNGQVMPTLTVKPGEPVRLRLINTSITRYYRFSLPGHTIYRVGGEGGLISNVQVEGGTIPGLRSALNDSYTGYTGMIEVDTGYDRGEILIGPAQRADVVIIPQGSNGDELTMLWKDFARGRHKVVMMPDGTMMLTEADDDGKRPNIDLFKIKLTSRHKHNYHRAFNIAEGDALVASVNRLLPERQDTQVKLQSDMMAMMMGMPKEKWFNIDDYPGVDSRTNYRTAKVGEVIEWEAHNYTDMYHPLHLHGFSFQPTHYVYKNTEEGYMDVWNINANNEFIDTVNIPPQTSVFYSFEVEDRPEFAAPVGSVIGGGAAGDWVFHCHIFQHGENGMMSFLRVSDE
jgi:FtsP/CotA-like multicopper oxidase with cupredoxin domain